MKGASRLELPQVLIIAWVTKLSVFSVHTLPCVIHIVFTVPDSPEAPVISGIKKFSR